MSAWIKCSDRLPEIDYDAPEYARGVYVIGWRGESSRPMEMRYCVNGYAKTEHGRKPRWEAWGRIVSAPTHWMPFPVGPEDL